MNVHVFQSGMPAPQMEQRLSVSSGQEPFAAASSPQAAAR